GAGPRLEAETFVRNGPKQFLKNRPVGQPLIQQLFCPSHFRTSVPTIFRCFIHSSLPQSRDGIAAIVPASRRGTPPPGGRNPIAAASYPNSARRNPHDYGNGSQIPAAVRRTGEAGLRVRRPALRLGAGVGGRRGAVRGPQ